MSATLLSERILTAKKDYHCQASECLHEVGIMGTRLGLTFAELRAIVLARKNKYRIKKGDKYLKQALVYDGDFYTFRAIPEIHNLMLRKEWYPE